MRFLCQGTEIEVRAMLECIAEGCGAVIEQSEYHAKVKTTYGELFQNTVPKDQMGISITILYSKYSGIMHTLTARFMADDLLARMHAVETHYVKMNALTMNATPGSSPETFPPFPQGTEHLRDTVKFPARSKYMDLPKKKDGSRKTDVKNYFQKDEKYFKTVGNLLDVGVETLKPWLRKHFQEMMRAEFAAIGANDEEVEEVDEKMRCPIGSDLQRLEESQTPQGESDKAL